MTDTSRFWVDFLSRAGRTVAAPSWVIADTLPANCRFLEGKVHEAGLLFFETQACLAYGKDDLPPDMSDLALQWHVHLPLDLPWQSPERAADTCLALMDKVAYLGARRAVLHPPQPGITLPEKTSVAGCMQALEVFAQRWLAAGYSMLDCLLENVRGADLVDIVPVITAYDFGVCLDTGHVLSYRQYRLLESRELFNADGRVRMVHLNAPHPGGPVGKHAPLTMLDAHGLEITGRVLELAGPDAVLMMELFRWSDVEASLPVVARLLGCKENGEAR